MDTEDFQGSINVTNNILLEGHGSETQEYHSPSQENIKEINETAKEKFETELPLLTQPPKKPLSAWMVFSIEGRHKIMKEYKSGDVDKPTPQLSMVEITKMLGEKYRNLSEEEKAYYDSIAEKNKEVYNSNMAIWKSQEKQRIDSGMQMLGEISTSVIDGTSSTTMILPLVS